MFDEYLNPPPSVDLQVPVVNAPEPIISTVIPLSVEEADHDIEIAHMDNNPNVDFLIPEPTSEESSTQELVYLAGRVMITTLKWIYKVKLDEQGDVNDGKLLFFLGLQISQSPRGIFLNQSKYALESLKKYGMETYESLDTPMVEKSKLDEDPLGKVIDPTRYHG
ncbi:retrovirus-related pol polyprotein from transposon TNT 1-94 [Tanacetum coccineum]|uniref:Retrovirus-related pol polyprotein from transposon TNT 1-94 n=1 Tax=Tanacetum coccineum TaxID=301880 RepID=A0ABQ5BEY9_9ASTR